MIACFDFDKTLVNKDTTIGFYKHCSSNYLIFYFKLSLYLLAAFLYKFKLINNKKMKELGVLFFLKGLSEESYLTHSINYGRLLKRTDLFKRVKHHLSNGDQVIILTASFYHYVSEVFSKLPVKVIGSELTITSGKVDQLGSNCFGPAKVEALNKIGIKEIDLFFTDSYDDKPLMKISKKNFLVSYNKDKIDLKAVKL